MKVDPLGPIEHVWCIMWRNATFACALACINKVARVTSEFGWGRRERGHCVSRNAVCL